MEIKFSSIFLSEYRENLTCESLRTVAINKFNQKSAYVKVVAFFHLRLHLLHANESPIFSLVCLVRSWSSLRYGEAYAVLLQAVTFGRTRQRLDQHLALNLPFCFEFTGVYSSVNSAVVLWLAAKCIDLDFLGAVNEIPKKSLRLFRKDRKKKWKKKKRVK